MEIDRRCGGYAFRTRDKFPEDYRRWQQCPDELWMVVPQDREQWNTSQSQPLNKRGNSGKRFYPATQEKRF